MRKSKNETSIQAYNLQADSLTGVYNQLGTLDVLPGLDFCLPAVLAGRHMNALDVGCGSGRDAFWLAERGFHVVAFDAADAMVDAARRDHSHPRIRYLVDRLPAMTQVASQNLKFNAVIMSAVWMHLSPYARRKTVENLRAMVATDAVIYISLRHGQAPDDRPMYGVGMAELDRLARANGMTARLLGSDKDQQGRNGVWWQYATLSL